MALAGDVVLVLRLSIQPDVAAIAVNAGKKVAFDVLAVDFLPGLLLHPSLGRRPA